MELSKPNPANPSSTRILSKFVNNTDSPMEGISFQVSTLKADIVELSLVVLSCPILAVALLNGVSVQTSLCSALPLRLV